MSYQNVSISGDFSIVSALALGYTICHKHRNTIKLYTINLNSGVGELMYVVRESVDVGAIEAIVMVATDKNFMFVWQVTKPVEEIKGLLFCEVNPGADGGSCECRKCGVFSLNKA